MKTKAFCLLGFCLCFSLLSVIAGGQQPKKPFLAVLSLEGRGIKAEEAALITASVEEAVFNTKAYELVTRLKIDAAWGRLKTLFKGVCGEECAVQIGKDLAAGKVMFGFVGLLGSTYQVQLKLVDVESAKVENMKSIRVDTPLGQLPDHIGKLVNELIPVLPPAKPAAPALAQAPAAKPEEAKQAAPDKAAAPATVQAPAVKPEVAPSPLILVFPPDKIAKGTGDGQFDSPCGVALDSAGNIYVADTLNGRIQVFTNDGTFVRKWGSEAVGDRKFLPRKLAVDAAGNVYVTDEFSHAVYRFSASGGTVKKWGTQGSAAGQFNHPRGIAISKNGVLFVVDMDNNRIQKFDTEGLFKGMWGEEGSKEGQFVVPHDIALDNLGFVYVTDAGNSRIQKFNTMGGFEEAWGTNGQDFGMFRDPDGIAVDYQKKIYVADTGNNWIQKFSNVGSFLRYYGTKGLTPGRFNGPKGVAVDPSGAYMVIADTINHRIQKISLK